MAEDLFRLFDEYAVRVARGERPDVRAYLERAGGGADELAGMIDRLLAAAPAPDPGEGIVAALEGWAAGEPPLLALRVRRGLRRDAVVAALVRGLGLDRGRTAKVARYYHRLETGLLDAARVDARVFEALAQVLSPEAGLLAAWRPPGPEAEAAYLRAPLPGAAAAVPPEPEGGEWDEVDDLFAGRD